MMHAQSFNFDQLCVFTLSTGRYVVFRKRGSVQKIPQLFDAICHLQRLVAQLRRTAT